MKKKKENRLMNILKITALLVIVSIITISLTKLAYDLYQSKNAYATRTMDARFSIGEQLAFNSNPDILDFGIAPHGGSSSKTVVLYHEYKKPLKVVVIPWGSIAKVLVPIEPFYITPNKKINLTLTVKAIGYSPSMYTGKIRINLIKDEKT